MKREKYFPAQVAKQRVWLVNYKDKIATVGASMGMSAAEIAAEQSICDAIIDAIDKSEAAKAEAKAKVKAKDLVVKGEMDKMRPLIATHKNNTGYTDAIGALLKIVGDEISFDPLKVKSTVTLNNTPQGVDIKFTLEHCECGNIYCKRGKEEDFTFLKRVIHPHTIDTRPNEDGAKSELRQYYVILMLNDEEVGKPSDIATIKN
jgi:hypothetical protein